MERCHTRPRSKQRLIIKYPFYAFSKLLSDLLLIGFKCGFEKLLGGLRVRQVDVRKPCRPGIPAGPAQMEMHYRLTWV